MEYSCLNVNQLPYHCQAKRIGEVGSFQNNQVRGSSRVENRSYELHEIVKPNQSQSLGLPTCSSSASLSQLATCSRQHVEERAPLTNVELMIQDFEGRHSNKQINHTICVDGRVERVNKAQIATLLTAPQASNDHITTMLHTIPPDYADDFSNSDGGMIRPTADDRSLRYNVCYMTVYLFFQNLLFQIHVYVLSSFTSVCLSVCQSCLFTTLVLAQRAPNTGREVVRLVRL